MFAPIRNLFALFTIFSTLFALTSAAPLELTQRDVWDPPVTYPRAGIVWKIGRVHNVQWDTSTKPAQVTNPIGQVFLRHNGSLIPSGPGSFDEPLASGFNLTDGRVQIAVPDVPVGCGYQLVLMGDSGNFSPEFIIAAEGD